ncbi:MAG: DNA repair protein RadC [Erysipelotrichaceae bacterium]|nr:DNA repair protein RadC [Erysipelotrichaceae bacterium]MDO5085354.1 DNA repair protein RadC [Erysipelotrichaceae bacterium]
MNYQIKEIPLQERPREKAMAYGVKTLSNRELLAIIIRSGYSGVSSLQLADQILVLAQGSKGLKRLQMQDLMKVKGIKQAKAIEILACFELSKRITYEHLRNTDVIGCPDDLVRWLNHQIGHEFQEHFVVVYLDVKNQIIDFSMLFKGTLDRTLIHPREIFKEAVLKSAASIIVAHNHPSGSLTPSKADISITEQLEKVGKLMNIHLQDHLIVNGTSFFSFRQQSLL